MIAIFKGVNNTLGFDLREFEVVNGVPKNYKWLKIENYIGNIQEYPVFTARIAFQDDKDFFKQFENTF